MTTIAASLPACPGCAGGREVNGLPCRDCRGTGRQGGPSRLAGGLRAVLHGWSLAGAVAAGTVVRWSRSVPGVAGAGCVTMGGAMITHAIWPRVPVLAAALVAGGVFGLLADRQL